MKSNFFLNYMVLIRIKNNQYKNTKTLINVDKTILYLNNQKLKNHSIFVEIKFVLSNKMR